ncbi:hypothetical protein HPB50_003115 [Hyalomma asiaticum]|uniref:Uncharacterized protein n=1 Tax=Hyalomma asiaticum TaxID=266040 RepID=A0ACB7S4A6_HYAAI|nr:hypothetical protein HPB50_003115 [Hyalomma asiaticum]
MSPYRLPLVLRSGTSVKRASYPPSLAGGYHATSTTTTSSALWSDATRRRFQRPINAARSGSTIALTRTLAAVTGAVKLWKPPPVPRLSTNVSQHVLFAEITILLDPPAARGNCGGPGSLPRYSASNLSTVRSDHNMATDANHLPTRAIRPRNGPNQPRKKSRRPDVRTAAAIHQARRLPSAGGAETQLQVITEQLAHIPVMIQQVTQQVTLQVTT